MADIEDFQKLDIRVGRITSVDPFSEGRYSTHVLLIDLGPELGVRKSVARLAPNYEGAQLVGREVLAVVNLPIRQIGPHRSEVLTLGVPDESGNIALIQPDRDVPIGSKLS